MPVADYLIGGALAVGLGLDRTAAFQFMVSRPIVAGPLTGCLLGDAMAGLQIGGMIELLWLGRLPVGAAVPPDDTQVAIGATVLAVSMSGVPGFSGLPFILLCTLVAMPLGKVGQYLDRGVRHWNGRILQQAEMALADGRLQDVEKCNLWGIVHFAISSLGTFSVIVGVGALFLRGLAPWLLTPAADTANWLKLAFPLVGVAGVLCTINVKGARTLFAASFSTALLILWLL
jgi:PTS system mannose-specific IIC component